LKRAPGKFFARKMDGMDEEAVKREFNIPADKVIPMLIAVGVLRPGTTLLPGGFRRGPGDFMRIE
jgi:hypothetical protein